MSRAQDTHSASSVCSNTATCHTCREILALGSRVVLMNSTSLHTHVHVIDTGRFSCTAQGVASMSRCCAAIAIV